jgi:predicted nucleic acid-binding protein
MAASRRSPSAVPVDEPVEALSPDAEATGPMHSLIEVLEAAGERRATAAVGAQGWGLADDFAATLAVLRADYESVDESESPLAALSEVFGLDTIDAALLWLAAAGDLDATVGLAYGQLRGVVGAARPTVSLALELAGVPTATPEAFERLGAEAPLRRHRLVELTDAEPWLGRQLRVPDPVVAVLSGGIPDDPLVTGVQAPLVPLVVAGSVTIARAIERGVPLVWVRSAAGMSGTSMAAGAFEHLGLHSLAIDLRRNHPDHGMADVVAAAARTAGLRGWGLVVTGCEAVDTGDRSVFEILERAAVPVVAVSAKPWNPSWSPRFPLVIDAGPLSVEDRSSTWKAHLGEVVDEDPHLRETLLGLRLSAEDIVEASRYAHVLAAARGVDLDASVVREAARRVGGSSGTNNDRIIATPGRGTGPGFGDLILPDHVTENLHQLVSWARHRDVVASEGVLRGRGRGIAALFTGSPGTGKTLAAHVISEELSIDLFQVDLSAIVDKYIGETEKNLERVFQAAEALDVVLFFDEADALFGSRSDVKDARDRYANQEVAYLLQRMEHFDGITILSTNLRGNLDKAFSRRMSFIIHFPDPDAPTRARLWRHHLAQLSYLDHEDPVDVDYLATAVELAGGDIRNIVLGAAYDAASADQAVGMRHVTASTVREYRKLGRVVPDHGFARLGRK